MLAAGLEGIEKQYPLPEPIQGNVYEMSNPELIESGISQLPRSLLEAIQLSEGSELLKRALGPSVFDAFMHNKWAEWTDYANTVTDYEVNRYLRLV